MNSTYFPHFTIGSDAYDKIPDICGEYGKTATYSRLSSLMSGPNGCREFLAQVNKLSNSIQSANYQQAAALVKEIEESCSKHPAAMPQAKLQIFYCRCYNDE